MSGPRTLTGKQRYWQAVRKARLQTAREIRLLGFNTQATMDRERDNIIAELERLQRALDHAGAT
jgi:hypothetical protein